MQYYLETPTTIDFSVRPAPDVSYLSGGNAALRAPTLIRATGNLTIVYVAHPGEEELVEYLVDHLLLWEWEGAGLTHRIWGLIALGSQLTALKARPGGRGNPGLFWYMASWYIAQLWAAKLGSGYGSFRPLKPNLPRSGSKLVGILERLEYQKPNKYNKGQLLWTPRGESANWVPLDTPGAMKLLFSWPLIVQEQIAGLNEFYPTYGGWNGFGPFAHECCVKSGKRIPRYKIQDTEFGMTYYADQADQMFGPATVRYQPSLPIRDFPPKLFG